MIHVVTKTKYISTTTFTNLVSTRIIKAFEDEEDADEFIGERERNMENSERGYVSYSKSEVELL